MKQWFQCGWLLLTALWTAEAAPRLPMISPESPFSFVVLGDNRGDDSGQQPPAFREVLAAIEPEAPSLILDSGDMVYGHTRDLDELEEQWRIYRQTVSTVRAPLFHVPGNHDLWNRASAELYQKLWGPTHYAFTYGNSRFIALDTESASGRLDEEQLSWLTEELKTCKLPNAFLFMHRPLFPVDGGIGSSLDAYPEQRNRLHQLFVQHRQIVRAVFSGHEHLYAFQERDGIRYYTSGGGGAPLYTAPERGGFHHFLKVNVAGTNVEVLLHKVCAPQTELLAPRKIGANELLETWNQGLICFAWDRTASVEITEAAATEGRRALRLNFDLNQYAWPVLVIPFVSPRDLSDTAFVSVDVFVPTNLPELSIVMAAEGKQEHQSLGEKLKPGWNSIRTRLHSDWLPETERRRIQNLQWALSSANAGGNGYVLFDNLRVEHLQGRPEQLESWERPFLWRIFDESVPAEIRATRSQANNGLSLQVEVAKNNRPTVFCQLNPPLDLSQVTGFLLKLTADRITGGGLQVELILRCHDTDFIAPAVPVTQGPGSVRFNLSHDWLPDRARSTVEQVAFRFVTTNVSAGADVRLQQLSTASGN